MPELLMIPEIKTLLIAMSPFLELRGSIPIAIGVYHLPAWSAYIFSVMGNLLPAIFLLWLLESVSRFLIGRSHFFNRFFAWLFERTRKNHQKKFERWKDFALVILVAIPLPFTGVWTASLCSFVFGIPLKRALPLITLGVIIAGITVTLITYGILSCC